MLKTYIAEAVGSFIFFVVILTQGTNHVMIAVGLLIGILIASIASDGHLNPCVTAMVYMNGGMGGDESISYIAAQLAGAIMAVQWYKFYKPIVKS